MENLPQRARSATDRDEQRERLAAHHRRHVLHRNHRRQHAVELVKKNPRREAGVSQYRKAGRVGCGRISLLTPSRGCPNILATFRRKNSRPSALVPMAALPGRCEGERVRALTLPPGPTRWFFQKLSWNRC